MQRRAICLRSRAPVSISTLAACSPSAAASRLSEPGQLVADRRDLLFSEEGGELRLDPVNGGDQEVAGAHRQVRDPQVEERVSRGRFVALAEQRTDSGQMRVDGGLQRGVEQVLDRELLGEVRAGRLTLAGLVVDVDMPRRYDDLVAGPAGR